MSKVQEKRDREHNAEKTAEQQWRSGSTISWSSNVLPLAVLALNINTFQTSPGFSAGREESRGKGGIVNGGEKRKM